MTRHLPATVLAAFVSLWLLVASLGASGDPLMPPAFKTGKQYLVRYQQAAQVSGRGAPQVIRILMEVEIRCARKPRSPLQKEITSRFSRVKLEMGGLVFDSTDPSTADSPLAPMFSGLLKGSYVTTLNRDGSVASVEAPDELLKGNPLADTVGGDNMRGLLETIVNPGIPAGGVIPGATWEMEFQQELEEVGTVSGAYHVRYEGDEIVEGKPHAMLSWEGDLKAELQTRGAESDPRTPVHTKSQALKGTMSIDRVLGFPVSGRRSIQMEMTLPDPVRKGKFRTMPVRHETLFRLLDVSDL